MFKFIFDIYKLINIKFVKFKKLNKFIAFKKLRINNIYFLKF